MAAHRYWRIYASSAPNYYMYLGEIEFRATPGGADQCSGGTAIADSYQSGSFVPANAFDDAIGVNSSEWRSNLFANTGGQWIGYDFGAGNVVTVNEAAIYSGNNASYEPYAFDLQYSDDGSSWTTQWSVGSGATSGWSTNTWQVFTDPSYVASATGTLTLTDADDAIVLLADLASSGSLGSLGQKTFYFTSGAVGVVGGVSNYMLLLQDGGTPAAGSWDCGGWHVATLAPPAYSLFYSTALRLSATFQGTTTLTANPDPANGDCWVSPAPYTGWLDGGLWQITLAVDADYAHGQRGHLQMRVWASTTQDGTGSPRELTSVPVVSDESPVIAAAYTIYPTDLTWSAPPITLINEYLLLQFEWVIDVAGGDATDDVRIHIGSYMGSPQTQILTPAAPPTRTGTFAIADATEEMALSGIVPVHGTLALADTPDIVALGGYYASFVQITDRPDAIAFMGERLAITRMIAVSLVLGRPSFGSPTFSAVVPMPAANPLVLGSPIFGTPALAMAPTQLILHSPIFGTPALWQIQHLVAEDLILPVIFDTPRMHEVLSAVVAGVFLPDNVESGLKGGPRFSTSVFPAVDGNEYRAANWARSCGTWSLNLGPRADDDPDFLGVQAVFYACRGNAFGFCLKDWSDYRAKNQPLAAIPDTDFYQLQKVYSVGSGAFTRKVTRPKLGTVVIRSSGAPVAADINYAGGVVAATGANLTADFEFFVPVRFDTDALEIDVTIDGLVDIQGITLVELQE